MPPQPPDAPPATPDASPPTPPAQAGGSWWQRWWGLVVAVAAVLALLVAGTGWFVLDRLTAPDGTRVTLAGAFPDGRPPTDEALAAARDVLSARFETAGLPAADLDVAGEELVATFDGQVDRSAIETLIGPGELRFRKVIESFPDISPCAQLNRRPSGTVPPDQPDVACDGQLQYQLATAAVTEADVAAAGARLDQAGGWVVGIEFTAPGQDRWTALTGEASTNAGSECRTTGTATDACLVAIVLDNVVISAPEVTTVITGEAVISGAFDRAEAEQLAARLAHGTQPLALTVESYRP